MRTIQKPITTINKVALQAFYQLHRDEYVTARTSGDSKRWDEAYKWEMLPKAQTELAAFSEVTRENIGDIIAVLNKYKANFAHWIDMDDLSLLIEKQNGFQVLREIWSATPDDAEPSIESANSIANMLLRKRFSPSTYGYILAAKDPALFSIYRDAFTKRVLKLSEVERPGTLSAGEKYRLFNESATYIGELMKAEEADYAAQEWYTALNGQDFLYIIIQYPADDRKTA
jgi:hypothetical protein